jgi:hypothetical protein
MLCRASDFTALLAGLALAGGLCLAAPAAAGPEQQGFDLPPQSLAVGDSVGRAIFERDGKRVALPPKAVQERIERRGAPAATPAPALPAWPAKWGGDPDAPRASSY